MLSADDMLILLEVARSGTLSGAATALGVDHATVSRRLTALERELGSPVVVRTPQGSRLTGLGQSLLGAASSIERALDEARERARAPRERSQLSGLVRISSPDACGAMFIAPAVARLHAANPELFVELMTATRPRSQGPGVDIEVTIGEPETEGTMTATVLAHYVLGLYAAEDYLARHGEPRTLAGLAEHSIVFYVEPLMRVHDLRVVREYFPGATVQLASTNIFAQVEATAAGGGIGILPPFLAEPRLRRLLPAEATFHRKYVAFTAPESLRRPAAAAVLREIALEMENRREELMGALG